MPKKVSSVKEKLKKVVEFALKQKAIKPVALDLQGLTSLCDYFIICSGETQRQVGAIYDEIIKQCVASNIKVNHCEKDQTARWMVIDLFDIVVHVFVEDARSYYALENLWHQAKKMRIKS